MGNDAILDEGFFDNDKLMDPETCGTGSVYLPIGPFVTCMHLVASIRALG